MIVPQGFNLEQTALYLSSVQLNKKHTLCSHKKKEKTTFLNLHVACKSSLLI